MILAIDLFGASLKNDLLQPGTPYSVTRMPKIRSRCIPYQLEFVKFVPGVIVSIEDRPMNVNTRTKDPSIPKG